VDLYDLTIYVKLGDVIEFRERVEVWVFNSFGMRSSMMVLIGFRHVLESDFSSNTTVYDEVV
jgi:hypothetical protein